MYLSKGSKCQKKQSSLPYGFDKATLNKFPHEEMERSNSEGSSKWYKAWLGAVMSGVPQVSILCPALLSTVVKDLDSGQRALSVNPWMT